MFKTWFAASALVILAGCCCQCGDKPTSPPSETPVEKESASVSGEACPECCRPPDRKSLLKQAVTEKEDVPEQPTGDAPADPAKAAPPGGGSPPPRDAKESLLRVHPSLPPFPTTARYVADPVSLQDPAFEASVTAALATPLPTRTTPAPFVTQSLPDPFEFRATGRLTVQLPELVDPPPLKQPKN